MSADFVKFALTSAQIEKARSARETLSRALAGGKAIRLRVEALASRRDEIAAELEGRADALDLERFKARTALREQLSEIEKELEVSDADALPPAAVRANAAAIVLLRQILQPELERLVERATLAYRPFFCSDAGARMEASRSEVVRNFGGCLNCEYERDPSGDSVKQSLGWLDELIAGRNPWLRR